MTKLDEAIEAAIKASPAIKQHVPSGEVRAAIQAAVKALVPEKHNESAGGQGDMCAAIGHNDCRAETLKDAGIE